MGQKNNVWNHYFRDKKRFADLFNGVYFRGEAVIQGEALTEISGVYEETNENLLGNRKKKFRRERMRDVQMTLKTGEIFRLLALENQEHVNYAMPFRCMQYDTMEYSRQIDELQKKNQESNDYATASERVGRIKKIDRLVPVYTLCLYHGEDKWDGPRSLKDMMDFGDDKDGMSKYFSDYPLHLYCLNEQDDFEIFKTEIKNVFKIMKFRKDKRKLVSELNKSEFQKVDLETLEVISVALDARQIWNKREKYMQIEGEKEEVNMCPALQEWMEEERSIGMVKGMAESVLELLGEFGEIPHKIRENILCQQDVNILRQWLKKAAKVSSMEEFQEYLQKR